MIAHCNIYEYCIRINLNVVNCKCIAVYNKLNVVFTCLIFEIRLLYKFIVYLFIFSILILFDGSLMFYSSPNIDI